jgi:hypothetical protein
MVDAPTPPPAPPAPPAPPTPWYEGKAEAETIGIWQNRGLDLTDPAKIAIEMTKAHREAERHIGAPVNEILRIPKPNAPAAEIKAFWERLGVPTDAKGYDLTGVKINGQDIDAAFADTMRAALAANFVPKDRAKPIVEEVAKYLTGQETAKTAALNAKIAEQSAALDKLWGTNKAANMLAADQGAARLGIGPDEFKEIGKVIGLDRAAEIFRKIGAGTSEDTFHEGRQVTTPTSQSASARLAELSNDKAWGKRLLAGDAQAKAEFDTLTKQAIGWVPEAA